MNHFCRFFFYIFLFFCVTKPLFAQKQSLRIDLFRCIALEPNLEYTKLIKPHWDFRIYAAQRSTIGTKEAIKHFDFLENQVNNEPITTLKKNSLDFGDFKNHFSYHLSFGARYTLRPERKSNFFLQPMLDFYYLNGFNITNIYSTLDETTSTCCGNTPTQTIVQRYIHHEQIIKKGGKRSIFGTSLQLGWLLGHRKVRPELFARAGFNFGKTNDKQFFYGLKRYYIRAGFGLRWFLNLKS
jgi:hypothetical protein